jgi:DNA-binding NarL/FixJ family response regulator
MRLLCIARHPYLSGHIRRYFDGLGLDVATAVGIEEGVALLGASSPDVVLCDYDLLAAHPVSTWGDARAGRSAPLLAVSLTCRPEEMLLAPGQVAGCRYRPLLAPVDALAALRSAVAVGGVAIPPGARIPWGGARLHSPAHTTSRD